MSTSIEEAGVGSASTGPVAPSPANRTATGSGPIPADLATLRASIDDVDARLIELMSERLRLADATLSLKRALGLQAVDARREASVVTRVARLARERGLEPELVRDIFWKLIDMSRASQRAGARERAAR